MAAPLPIELRALGAGAVTVSGVSDTVDIEHLTSTSTRIPRTAARLKLELQALDVGTTLKVTVDTSSDGVAWAIAWTDVYDAVGEVYEAVFGKLRRYVRARWELIGGASATFSLAGDVHQIYCEPEDIVTFAVPEKSIEKVSREDRLLACIAASDKAEGEVAKGYTTPLRAWGGSLRSETAHLAAALIYRKRGKDSQGTDASVFEGETRSLSWLGRLGAGKVKPPDIIDSTPETYESAGFVVASRPSRRW